MKTKSYDGYDQLEDYEKEIFDNMHEYEHTEMDDDGKMVPFDWDATGEEADGQED